MEIIKRSIDGVYEVKLSPFLDERGFFMRTFDGVIFSQAGLERPWIQENHSRSKKKGILRGLHFQFPPFAETKLVRCIRGRVLDVFVDLREKSPTFGQWDSVELSEENKTMIFIPRGFAHGFCTLTDESEVLYKVDNLYNPTYEGSLLWNDPEIAIKWPTSNPILSAKDEKNITLKEFVEKFGALKI